MDRLKYFNLGFRAESSRIELEKLKRGESYNPAMLKDAGQLIKNCQEVWEEKKAMYESEEVTACRNVLLGDILILARGSQPRGIEIFYGREAIIKKTGDLVNSVLEGEMLKKDLELGIKFFDNFSKECLSLAQSYYGYY